jgi:exopolysaccharide biosynthesis WecB/TagA/CpsF family protein
MKVMNVNIMSLDGTEFGEKIKSLLVGPQKSVIGKINTEFLNRAQQSEEFAETLNSFDLNIADGRGVLWAARYLSLPTSTNRFFRPFQAIYQMIYSGAAIVINPRFITYPIQENIPGVEAFKIMLNSAIETDTSVFFFGALQQDLDGAIVNIRKEYPKLKIAGTLNGFDYQKDKTIDPVSIINNTDAKLLFVPQGSPLQEYWIRDNFDKLKNITVAVGEGGTLAFLSGFYRRAPIWMQQLGLEWLFRLFTKSLTPQTGSRIKRVWNAVPVFIYEVVKWKIKK